MVSTGSAAPRTFWRRGRRVVRADRAADEAAEGGEDEDRADDRVDDRREDEAGGVDAADRPMAPSAKKTGAQEGFGA